MNWEKNKEVKIKDQVSVIDENLSGTVTSVHGNRVVFIDDYGFTHSFRKDQLVLREHSLYENLQLQKKPEPGKTKSKKHHKKHFVLDLHFGKMVTHPERYESFERLFIQKEKLLETIAYCRKNNLKKLEIIHGIGDGTLQQMVQEVLISQTGLDFRNTAILHHQSGSVMVEFI